MKEGGRKPSLFLFFYLEGEEDGGIDGMEFFFLHQMWRVKEGRT